MRVNQLQLGLEDVVINSELLNRPIKAPNYEAENQALVALAQTLANAPDMILQRVAESALELCRADTAGISLLEEKDGAEVFRWKSLVGVLSDRSNSTMPRHASPCGTTIDRNATQLMYMAERVFPALKSEPPIVEALLIPFHVGNKPIGAVWVAAHDERRKFDREDERIVKRLSQFASASWQLWQARTRAEAAAENSHQLALDATVTNAGLQARLEDRTRAVGQLKELNRELQLRIAESAAALTRANAEIVNGNGFRTQLPHSESLVDIGALAAGIVHDFNNILHVIQGYAALIMSDPAMPKTVVENAEVIRTTVDEGVALARQLLAVSRKTETMLELADINILLHRTTKLLTPMFPTTIVIALDLAPRLPSVMIDSNHINQAILNLCMNARDAMPDGGRILLQTRIIPGAELRERFPGTRAEQYVYISVADTGVGMDADVRGRVFESFFTTKKPGQGTGLGLSVVHRIISEHAGFIAVTSESGCGSTFHIYLPIPRDNAAAAAVTLRQNKIEDHSRRRVTVLHAEDEVRLADLMRSLLENEGFRVLTAQDGAEAVEVHGRHKDEITVAILDSGLAKLNGWEAFQQMRKINPKLKGILTSGYVSAEAKSRAAKGELNGVLQKPYALEEVLATIRQAIHSQ